MLISLFFSFNNYQLSVNELRSGFRRQAELLDQEDNFILPNQVRKQLNNQRQEQYEIIRNRILSRLIATNIFILVGGGFISYYFARRTIKPIEDSKERQASFTADASHELRTPLAVMQSEIEVSLMDKKLNLKTAKDQLKSNLEEVQKLTKLSEGLLELTTSETHNHDKQKVYLKDLAVSSVNKFTTVAKLKKIKINKQIKTNKSIYANKSSLEQVVNILLDNAIKYSPAGSEVDLKAYDARKNVVLEVTNQGSGIDQKDHRKIFDRFYRVDKSRSKQNEAGHGLGLSIAKNIVELNGGKIEIKSALNKPTTFIVKLPQA